MGVQWVDTDASVCHPVDAKKGLLAILKVKSLEYYSATS